MRKFILISISILLLFCSCKKSDNISNTYSERSSLESSSSSYQTQSSQVTSQTTSKSQGYTSLPDKQYVKYLADTYTIVDCVSPDSDPLTFDFTIYYLSDEPIDKIGFGHFEVDLHISDQNNKTIQNVSFYASYYWGRSEKDTPKNYYHITDINFDGYKDILCMDSNFNGKGVKFYMGWVWNNEKQIFEQVDLGSISFLYIDYETESLIGFHPETGVTESYFIFKYIDGKFICTSNYYEQRYGENTPENREKFKESDRYASENRYYTLYGEYILLIIESQFIDGELQELSFDIDSTTEEGQQFLVDRYFGEDSIWTPRERFYSGYDGPFGGKSIFE